MKPELRDMPTVVEGHVTVTFSKHNEFWPHVAWISDGEVDIELSADQALAVCKALAGSLGLSVSATEGRGK